MMPPHYDIAKYVSPAGLGDILFCPCVSLSVYQSIQDTGCLVNATPPTVVAGSFLKLGRCFCQCLKICMMFGCNPQIIL